MMKKSILFSMIVLAVGISSCSVTKTVSVSEAPIGTKVGVSKSAVLFGIMLNKNYGVAEAAHIGGITGGVAVVDEKTPPSGALFKYIFYKKKITVYGN